MTRVPIIGNPQPIVKKVPEIIEVIEVVVLQQFFEAR
jgi:hypothetical protein